MIIEVKNEVEMRELGARIGQLLRGGEVIELIGDVGAGKTTLTKGIGQGMGIEEAIQSPTFTLSRLYDASDGRKLAHYDFYRLSDPGVMALELAETINEPKTSTIVEWADVVSDVLPGDRLVCRFKFSAEDERSVELTAHGKRAQMIVEGLA